MVPRVDCMFRNISHVSVGSHTKPFLGLGTSKNDGILHCLCRLTRAATANKSIHMLISSSENNVYSYCTICGQHPHFPYHHVLHFEHVLLLFC